MHPVDISALNSVIPTLPHLLNPEGNTHQGKPRPLSKCPKRLQKATKGGGNRTEAHFQKSEVHLPEVKRP